MSRVSFLRACGWVLAFGIAATHILGATRYSAWWGVHFYRFLPAATLWLACALLATCAWLAWRWPAWLERAFERSPGAAAGVGASGQSRRAEWPWLVASSAVSFWMFWAFREAHTLLGDGHPLTRNLPLGQQFHPDEPLALYLHHVFYVLARGLFTHPGRDASEVARDTVALSSALAGAVFVPIAWRLAREIAGASKPRGVVALAFLALIAQGYVQLFFGYVENYTLYCLLIAAFALASLRCLEGRAPLFVPGALVIVTTALHLGGGLLVPAFAVLLLRAASRRELWQSATRDLALCAALFLGMHFALAGLHPHYSWIGMLTRLGGSVTNAASSYGFKRPGIGDFLNQQALIGPLGLFLLVPAAAAALGAALRQWRIAFLLTASAAFLFASVIAGDSNLGVARNWDLLAPAGFVFTLAGLGLAMSADWSARDLQRWLFLLVAASLFHTVPWVANNASFDRAFARFKTLPLGLGRAAAVVGGVFLERGQEDSAAVWYRRALDENPANNLAAFQLGRIAMSHQDYDFACTAFIAALQARPGTQQVQYLLADALVRSGRFGYARREMDRLLAENDREPIYWAASSVIWQCLRERDSSQVSLARAESLAPGDSLLAELRVQLGRPDGFARALDAVWPKITLP